MTEITKYDLAGYIVGLQTIVTFQTTQTGDTVSGGVAREHARAYKQFRDMLAKEEEDEARKRKDDEQPEGSHGGEPGGS